MIDDVVQRWHRFLAGELPGGLDELLAEDVVFWSPCGPCRRSRSCTSRWAGC